MILSENRDYLLVALDVIRNFLSRELRLELHPNKIELRTIASGVDFLGWVHFSDHRVLRNVTKRRMFQVAHRGVNEATVASYKGLLRHGNTQTLTRMFDAKITTIVGRQNVVVDAP